MGVLQDGSGTKNLAKVDADGRLHTESITLSSNEQAVLQSKAYNINTDDITLTSAGTSAVFYLKNTGTSPIWIETLFYLLGSSNGSGDLKVTVYRNPTGGTITTSGTSISAVNRDFTSAESLGATIYKGGEALTITGGSGVILNTLSSSVGRVVIGNANLKLGSGNSLAIEITPPAGNTSMKLQIASSVHLINSNLGE